MAPHLKEVQPDAKILDIGCGDGKITADIAKFIPKGSILGIDLSNSMLEWARKQYHSLEYPNLFFKEGIFLETGIVDQFDLIVSFCALQQGRPSHPVFLLFKALLLQTWYTLSDYALEEALDDRLSFETVRLLSGQNKPTISGFVLGSSGAFSNQFIEGMKLLYELEPLIKVKPYLTNQ